VFSDAFTDDMLAREVSSGRMDSSNPPVFISSIAYGRILMFSLTSSSSESKIKAAINAIYNNGEFGGEIDVELRTLLQTASIRVVTVGGDANQAVDLIRENNLAA